MLKKQNFKNAIMFLAPALLIYGIFFVYPAIRALYVSFFEWSGFVPQMSFVGFDNFVELFRDRFFWISLKNTAVVVLIGGLFTLSISLFFAILISRRNLKGRRFFRLMVFIPFVIPEVGIGVVGTFFFDPKGLLNKFLVLLNLDSLTQVWLGPNLAMISILLVIIWVSVGFNSVIFLAGIEKIPPTFREAAMLDGASEWKIFMHVTLPMISDIIIITTIFWIIGSMKMFELIYSITMGGPNRATSTIAIFSYVMAFGQRETIYRMGYGTAAAVVLLILVIIGVSIVMIFRQKEAIEY